MGRPPRKTTPRLTYEQKKQIILNKGLVRILATRVWRRCKGSIEYDDLFQVGIIGLIDAIHRFEEERGIKLSTFASMRIHGEMLDYIRDNDWVPREARRRETQIRKAYTELELNLGREATIEEVADKLGITIEEVKEWESFTKLYKQVSIDEMVEQDKDWDSHILDYVPDFQDDINEEADELRKALKTLNEQEQRILNSYYYEDKTLLKIALEMGISESRVSQIKTCTLKKLRMKLSRKLGRV